MARTKDSPSHSGFSPALFEEASITDVNRKTWTVTAQSTHRSKTFHDVQVMSPYHHYLQGEGFNHLPEVGARCVMMSLSDNSPPILLGYIGVPGVMQSEDGKPIQGTPTSTSTTDVSYQSNRPDMNPGDMGFQGRDGNFFVLRRGGVLQIGATGIAQRIYLPIRNFIKDFAENYEMDLLGGDVSWTVERPELDPKGKSPATYRFQMQEYATDSAASVQIRHFPLSAPGGSKAAWEVSVAPRGINKDSGKVSGATYTLLVSLDGTRSEFIGGNRTITVKGNDALTVSGNRTATITGDDTTTAKNVTLKAKAEAVIDGKRIQLIKGATEPALLGNKFFEWYGTQKWVVTGGTVASPSPADIAGLRRVLSRKVFVG